MGEGPGAPHPAAKRRGRNAVKDREEREICLARKTAGRGNLSGRTVAAKKPEAARNKVQRRRALARIHDKYKAALGVILYRKDAWPQHRLRRNSVSGTAPEAIPVHVGRATKKEERSHRIRAASGSAFAAWKKLRIGTLSVSHRRLADYSPALFRTACTTFERGKLRRVRAPPPAGRPLLGSRALECQYLCRDTQLHLRPLDSHQRDSGFADDLVRIVGLNAECGAPVPQPFEPSA